MALALFFIALLTSIVGSICGVGGGVITKPVLDAMNIMTVSAISFLSGCTVLAMAVVSVGKSLRSKQAHINRQATPALSVGAAVGGVVGKVLFHAVKDAAGNEHLVGMVQAALLALITALTFLYMRETKKGRIRTLHLSHSFSSAAIGLALGIVSSFLGIGGGPINLAALSFFFSMDAKEAAGNSLCIILLSQAASLLQAFATASVPAIDPLFLCAMIAGGILGGFAGQSINKKLSPAQVGTFFNGLMLLVTGISICNAAHFAALL